MKKARVQKAFFEELRKVPIIHFACNRVGISRQSVYRWKSEDPAFAKQMLQAMEDGEEYINDMTESQLITLIQEKKWPAMKYWLDKNHKRYRPRSSDEGLMRNPQDIVFSDETMEKIKAMQDRWNKDKKEKPKKKKDIKVKDVIEARRRFDAEKNQKKERNDRDRKPPIIFA